MQYEKVEITGILVAFKEIFLHRSPENSALWTAMHIYPIVVEWNIAINEFAMKGMCAIEIRLFKGKCS